MYSLLGFAFGFVLLVMFLVSGTASGDSSSATLMPRSFKSDVAARPVAATYKIIRDFPNTDFLGGVVALNGNLFFPLYEAGTGALINEISPVTGKYFTIHQFGGVGGEADWLTPDDATNTLYGVSVRGGHGSGFVFAQTVGGAYRHLYDFPYNGPNGYPLGPILEVGGTLYGTCATGVYSISPSGAFGLIPIYGQPHGNLVVLNGTLYGMTVYGGSGSLDSIFSISPNGALTTRYSALQNSRDPNNVWSLQELYAFNGLIYGTAQYLDWPADDTPGSLFELPSAGSLNVLSYISDPTYFTQIIGGVANLSGNFYGQTYRSLYEVTSTGTASIIKEFPRYNPSSPAGDLAVLNGVLYGAYNYDYGSAGGWIYSITP